MFCVREAVHQVLLVQVLLLAQLVPELQEPEQQTQQAQRALEQV